MGFATCGILGAKLFVTSNTSRVFVAEETSLGRSVVVKVLPRQKEMPADIEETMTRVVSIGTELGGAGTVTRTAAEQVAKAIGSATEAYGKGDTALFAVHSGNNSAVYLFTSSGNDAVVSNGELQQIATLTGVQSLTSDDIAF